MNELFLYKNCYVHSSDSKKRGEKKTVEKTCRTENLNNPKRFTENERSSSTQRAKIIIITRPDQIPKLILFAEDGGDDVGVLLSGESEVVGVLASGEIPGEDSGSFAGVEASGGGVAVLGGGVEASGGGVTVLGGGVEASGGGVVVLGGGVEASGGGVAVLGGGVEAFGGGGEAAGVAAGVPEVVSISTFIPVLQCPAVPQIKYLFP
jgi:hypothetical protein